MCLAGDFGGEAIGRKRTRLAMSRLFTGLDPFLGCFVSILSRAYQSDVCSRNTSSSLTGYKKANEIESEIMWNH